MIYALTLILYALAWLAVELHNAPTIPNTDEGDDNYDSQTTDR